MFAQYDPAKLIVIFRTRRISGFGTGTYVTFEKTQNAFEFEVGGLGDVVRRRITDESGTVGLTLLQTAPSNGYLTESLALDIRTGRGFGPLLIRDLNGTTVASAAIAWVRKSARVELANTVSDREWMIDCARLRVHVGGGTQVGV